VWVLPFVHISRDTLHYLTILRLARLVLMLLKLPSYELLGICLMKMLPACTMSRSTFAASVEIVATALVVAAARLR
jgi:hypothetical protein